MAYVQPRGGEVVQPKSDFQYDEATQTLTYFAKTNSRTRMILAVVAFVPLLFVGVPSLILGMMTGSQVWVTVGIICLGLVGLLLFWSSRPATRPIIFDPTSITVKGRKYLLEHVTQIGHSNSGGFATGGTGMQGAGMIAGAMIGHGTSGQVYIVYGADQVPIITGLSPEQTGVVYAKIIGFLERFGYHFA